MESEKNCSELRQNATIAESTEVWNCHTKGIIGSNFIVFGLKVIILSSTILSKRQCKTKCGTLIILIVFSPYPACVCFYNAL